MTHKFETVGTPGSLPPEPAEERESVSTVVPEDYPNPANGNDIAGDVDRAKSKEALNDGSLSSSEMQDAGLGEDEGPTE